MATATDNRLEAVPLDERERRIWADIAWVEQNAEVRKRHAGEWVAIHERTIIAHGVDREQVAHEAAAALQRPAEDFAVWPVVTEEFLLSNSSAS